MSTTVATIGADSVTPLQVLCDRSAQDVLTISTLRELTGPSLDWNGGLQPFALVPTSRIASGITSSAEEYLRRLTRSACAAAASVYCGSILAGHTSESDEFGDLAVWLGEGEFGQGREREVMSALGLNGYAREAGLRPKPLELTPVTGLPTTVKFASGLTQEAEELAGVLKRLTDTYGFYITGKLVIYLLLGRHETLGWVGLVGIGVES